MEIKKDGSVSIELDDEQLDQVGGGDSIWGTATGVTCKKCGFEGPHRAELLYDRVDNTITFHGTVIHCGECGEIIKS